MQLVRLQFFIVQYMCSVLYGLGHCQGCYQEAQLMLTNLRNALRGQSRSPNNKHSTIPYVRYFSSGAIVTLRFAIFPIFDFKKCRDPEIWVRCQRSLKVIESGIIV